MQVAKAGPTSDLIALLKDGTPEAKAYALWSLSLSINSSNQKTLLDEDGIEPLVAALKSPIQVPPGHLMTARSCDRLMRSCLSTVCSCPPF